jgi:hypothetical protein
VGHDTSVPSNDTNTGVSARETRWRVVGEASPSRDRKSLLHDTRTGEMVGEISGREDR